jgi:ATP-binding cassette subfamily B protein
MALSSNDISAAREFLGPAIMYGANTITAFVFVLYFMLSLNPSITFISLIPLPIIAFTVYKIGNKIHVAFRNVQEQFATMTTQAQESFSGIRVVRSYNREEYEGKQFSILAKDYFNKNIRLARIQAITMPVMMVLVGSAQIIVLGYGGWQVLKGQATLGDLTQFFIYVGMLIWPIAAIGWITNIIQQAAASMGRLAKILDAVPEIKDNNFTNHNIKDIEGDIEFQNVSLKYEPDLPEVLSDVTVDVSKGTSLGIVGAVGSGKSSFVNLLPRMFDTTKGQILVDGNDIKSIPLSVLRDSIGIVTQEPFLFSMSIAENIRFGKPDATFEEIEEAAKIAQFDIEIDTFPEKYDSVLGERGITLSGGQKQRLAIARAVLKNPKILILDDALSAVDAHTEDKILNNLNIFMRNRTTILISHRISTVKNADKIIALEDGVVTESGTHEELLRNEGRYAEMFSLQQLEQEIEQL